MLDQKTLNNRLKSIKPLLQKGDSPALDALWEEIVEILSKNEKETEEYLSLCNADEISLLADFFEDISCELQSKSFVKFLRDLQKKFPDLDMEQDITWAEEAIT